MKKLFICLPLVISLTACTGTMDAISQSAGLGSINQEKSSFDDSTIVSMSPNFLVERGRWKANDIRLGARWLSSDPENVYLVLAYASNSSRAPGTAFTDIRGIDINIGGQIQSFETKGSTKLESSDFDSFQRTFHTTSTNAVRVPMSLLRAMVDAPDCRLRIRSADGFEESHFSMERNGEGGAATARLTLREFLRKVDTAVAASY